jgi:tetratricopeptide (TPR) repeat protein
MRITAVIAGLAVALHVTQVHASDVLDRARALYDAAQYSQAIELLDQSGSGSTAEAQQYRALCLLGLGRTDAAEQAMKQIVAIDPHFALDATSVSPRVVSMFESIRRRNLPPIIRRGFADATSLFRAGARQEAGERFAALLRLLDDPVLAAEDDLATLAVAARGFVELGRAQAEPAAPSEPPAPAEAPLVSAPIVVEESPSFVAPVAIERTLPSWHPPNDRSAAREFSGAITVSIDAEGKVRAATRKQSIHPFYDPLVLAAARNWVFRPALKDGRPVASEVTVEVTLSPPDR